MEKHKKQIDKLPMAEPRSTEAPMTRTYSEMDPEYRPQFHCPTCGAVGALTEPR